MAISGIAKIRANPHFSVDFFRIKAYYSIVRMGKAKAASDGGGTKEAKAERLKCFAVLYRKVAHFWQNFSASVFSVCSCSNSLVAAGRAVAWRLLRLGVGFFMWILAAMERKERRDKNLCSSSLRSMRSFAANSSSVSAGRVAHFRPFRGKSIETPLHEPFTRQTERFQSSPVKAGQAKLSPIKPLFLP